MKLLRRLRAVSPGSVGLAIASVFALGILTGLAAYPDEAPPTLRAAASPDQMPVTLEQFDDAHDVELQVVRGSPRHVTSPLSGRVTALNCAPGETVTSGTSPMSVDGQPVVALWTKVPLWRNLTRGITGADVIALQQELTNLGYPVRASGKFDHSTASAVSLLLSRIRRGGRTIGLPLSATLWLPERRVQTATCDVQLGDPIGAGNGVFTTAAQIVGVTVKTPPADAVIGRRVLLVDGQRLTLDGHGVVRDRNQLTRLATSASFQLFLSSNGAVPLHGAWALAEPLTVGALPPSSLIAREGTGFCVQGKTTIIPVTVISSMAGRSLVTFAAGTRPPDSVRVSTAPDARCG